MATKVGTKETLLAELKAMGVEVPAELTVLELKALIQRAKKQATPESGGEAGYGRIKKNMLASLTGLPSVLLSRALTYSGEVMYLGATKGEMLLKVRELSTTLPNKPIGFGKCKGQTYQEVLENNASYRQWIIREAETAPECCPELKQLAMYFRFNLTRGFHDWQSKFKEDQEEFTRIRAQIPKCTECTNPRHEAKTEPKVKTEIPKAAKAERKKQEETEEVQELSSESSEELVEDAEEPSKKGRGTSSTDPDSATSWMELGEKRKGRSVLRPMRRK